MASNMSSLMDLVAQNQPRFQTHQALLVIGLQNDFIQPDGRLPVNTNTGYLDRIQALIPKFRELNGNVIWVQTLYEADRIASDANTGEGDALVVGGLIDGDESGTEGGEEEPSPKDLPQEKSKPSKHKQRALDLLKRVSARRKTIPREVAQATAEQDDELFLLKSEKRMPACVPNTYGAEFADVIARQFELPADMVIRTTNYSAFQGTSLLMTLRAKLVTEVYICGCITNVSVLATVIDAARHGVKINVIEDCLGYRKLARHELALKRMDEFFDAYIVNSPDILARERPETAERKSASPNGSRKGSKGTDKQPLETTLGRLSLNDPDARPSSRPQSMRSPTKVLTGGPRKLSLISVAESRKALSTPPSTEPAFEPTDEQFADKLVQGAPPVPIPEEHAQKGAKEEVKLVTKKIRMRSKGKKKKKREENDAEDSKDGAATANGEPSVSAAVSKAEQSKPVTVASSASAAAAETPKSSSRPTGASPRSSVLAKAESVLNLRERTARQQSLKSVASQPVLSAKVDNREKEKDRESWSDRVRLSLGRASKSESASEAKKRASVVSTKAPSTISKAESRPASVVSKLAEPPATPSRAPLPPPKDREVETLSKKTIEQEPSPASVPVVSEPPSTPSVASTTAETKSPTMVKSSKLQSLSTLPVLGPGDTIAEGDSHIIHDFFPTDQVHLVSPTKPIRDVIFTQLYNEVQWQKMLHQQGEVPRLVCCQGDFGDDGSMPVYRHPTDQSLPLLHFSPRVQLIKKQAEKLVGHPLNHVLIQLYRSGNDYISEHSDKTLDIVKGSSIVNVSFGAQRTMRLRTKKPSKSAAAKDDDKKDEDATQRETQRVPMPHNSMFVLGLESNAKWLHGIMPDKRLATERSAAELAYGGMRISLTFRNIGTFLDARESTIWGQGASAKEQSDAADVINNDTDEAEKLIRAFSQENHSSEFDWDKSYGEGFDLLHLNKPPEDIPILFKGAKDVESKMVQLALAEAKIKVAVLEAPGLEGEFCKDDRQVILRDNDVSHTEIVGATSILLYLDRYYSLDRDERSKSVTANAYSVLPLALDISKAWEEYSKTATSNLAEAQLKTSLAILEDISNTHGGPFIAGKRFSIADCAVWPVVDLLVDNWDAWDADVYSGLAGWYKNTWKKKACVKKMREKLGEGKEKTEKEGAKEEK